MKKYIDKKQLRFYLLTAGGFLIIHLIIQVFEYPETIIKRIINSFFLITYLTFFNFVLFEYTIPFIKPTPKRILLGLLLVGAHLFFYSFGLYGWRHLWIQAGIYTSFKTETSFLKAVAIQSQFSLAVLIFFRIVRHFYNYNKLKVAAKQLRIEKQEAELNYLKSQTNPHFLFNTLNNIYSLARDKSELAPESILRLSKILRFMLYETSGEYILIEQELKIINDYIALEKLRYDDSLNIIFNQEIEDLVQLVPPLLLIPLIENAFKHGISETRNNPFINIQLSIYNQQLLFIVKNSTGESSQEHIVKENIGLSNLRRQLELLYKQYYLNAKKERSIFTTTLKINLTSHV